MTATVYTKAEIDALLAGYYTKAQVDAAITAATTAIIPATAVPVFVGDYSTGNFSQWPGVQIKGYNSTGKSYTPTYSAALVTDPVRKYAARFEVRAGDIPFGTGERAQVSAQGAPTGGVEGQTFWYRLAHKFDTGFPANHADLGWGVTAGWHPDSDTGSGPFQLDVGSKNGYWTLYIQPQSAPGVYLGSFGIWDTPLNPGAWHDVILQVHYSTSDTMGWLRLWHNGVRQTFTKGLSGTLADNGQTYNVRTLLPGTSTVYYKEGYYRQPMAPTGVVFCTGFTAYRAAS